MAQAPRTIGLVVHPTRDVSGPLDALRRWSREHEARWLQIPVDGQQQEVADLGPAEDCDVVLAIGGDGTALAAIKAAAPARRPVIGVACGSLGALTSVSAGAITVALDRFSDGEWTAKRLPALEVSRAGAETLLAYNDIAIVRRGTGQVRAETRVDGSVFARLAGDGCIVSTTTGSSAYALAAGGPLLAPDAEVFLLTPLSNHGGRCPPLVIAAGSTLAVEVTATFGGARLELDGKIADACLDAREVLEVRLRPGAASVVTFDGDESFLTALRERSVIIDSPRFIAEQRRAADR